jgi:hypothetical protein
MSSVNKNGLLTTVQVGGTSDLEESSFFILRGDPTYIENLAADSVTANTVIASELEATTDLILNGGVLDVSGGQLRLNGTPVGAQQTLEQVLAAGNSAGIYNIDMSGNTIQNCGAPVLGSDVATKAYADSIALADAALWSQFPAQSTVRMNNNRIVGVSTINETEGRGSTIRMFCPVNVGNYNNNRREVAVIGNSANAIGDIIGLDLNSVGAFSTTGFATGLAIQSPYAPTGSATGLFIRDVQGSNVTTAIDMMGGSLNPTTARGIYERLASNKTINTFLHPLGIGRDPSGGLALDISGNTRLSGTVELPSISTVATSNVLYYNTSGGGVTYGALPTAPTPTFSTATTNINMSQFGLSNVSFLSNAGTSINLSSIGLLLPTLSTATTSNVLYYNTSGGGVTYGALPTAPTPTFSTATTNINMAQFGLSNVSFLSNASNDLNIAANDLNLNCTGLTSVLNITSVLGTTIAAGGAVDITSGGATLVNAVGPVIIGSAAHSEIENLRIDNSVVGKVGSTADLTYNNIQKLNDTTPGSVINTRAAMHIQSLTTPAEVLGFTVQQVKSTDEVVCGFYANDLESEFVDCFGAYIKGIKANTDSHSIAKGVLIDGVAGAELAVGLDMTGAISGGTKRAIWEHTSGGAVNTLMNPVGIGRDPSGNALDVIGSCRVTASNTAAMAYMDSIFLKSMFLNYPQRYVFDIAGIYTLTLPAPGFNRLSMFAYGAGGGGGSGRLDSAGSCFGGGAGSGGNGFEGHFDRLELFPDDASGVVFTITIGEGGAGGAAVTTNATNGNNGSAGGQTSITVDGSGGVISLAYQLTGGNGGSGGTNSAGAGGGAPTWSPGTFGAAGRPGGSSSITAIPGASTAGNTFHASMFHATGGSSAGGGVNAGATVAYAGGGTVTPALQYYGVPTPSFASPGSGFGGVSIPGAAGTVSVPATNGGEIEWVRSQTAAIRPLRGSTDVLLGGGGSVHPSTPGGNGGGHTAGQPGSRGSGGAGGGGAVAVASGAGGRGRDGMVYLCFW